MKKKYYQLSTEPFGLTPDPEFVYAHQGYRSAQADMQQHMLENSEGILAITGRTGIGKSTLTEGFLAGLTPDNVLTATLDNTDLENNDVLRTVADAFGIDAKGMDTPTLFHELEKLLTEQTHALLIIDEAHKLSQEALEELRLLIYMRYHSRPLLPIILLGQEQLHEHLKISGITSLSQSVITAHNLEPLSLQETCDYVVHRLSCADWCGNPVIATEAFVLIHRFSQGLPLYINKLCAPLILHGASEQSKRLNTDDVVTVIRDEQLLPVTPGAHPQDPIQVEALPVTGKLSLTAQEQEFIDSNPAETRTPSTKAACPSLHPNSTEAFDDSALEEPASESLDNAAPTKPVTAAPDDSVPTEPVTAAPDDAAQGEAVVVDQLAARAEIPATQPDMRAGSTPPRSGWLRQFDGRAKNGRFLAYSVVALAILAGTYFIKVDNADQDQTPVSSQAFDAGVEPELPGVGKVDVKAPTESTVLSNTPPQSLVTAEPHPTAELEADGSQSVDEVSEAVTRGSPPGRVIQPSVVAAGKPAALADTVEPGELPAIATDTPVALADTVEPNEPPAMATDTPVALPDTVGPNELPTIIADTPVALSGTVEPNEPPAIAADTPAVLADTVEQTPVNERIEQLLLLGEEALAEYRLRTPADQCAWLYYKQVLELNPGNEAAQHGLERIVVRYGELTTNAIKMQRYRRAQTFINRGLSVAAGDDRLLALQKKVEVGVEAQRKRAALLALQANEAAKKKAEQQSRPQGVFGTLKKLFTNEPKTE